MKIIFKILLVFTLGSNAVRAQVQFSDDFTNTMLGDRWLGEVENFRVNAEGELQLNAPEAGTSYISVPYALPDSTIWDCYFRMEFDPSGSNRLRLWLISDTPDLDSGDGYYLEVGESGSTDALRFYKKSGSTRALLASATEGALAVANAEARVRVELNEDGQWRLSVDYTGGSIYSQEFVYSDPDFTMPEDEVYFGFHCAYTSTRIDLSFFDDVRIAALEPDTVAPVLTQFEVQGTNMIQLRFNEALSPSSAPSGIFLLSPGAGMSEARFVSGSSAEMVIEFDNNFTSQSTYQLAISGVSDLAGNTMGDTTISFTYYIFEAPESYDVLFTEIMARPSPPLGLPNAEYFELYNRSDKVINLVDLVILDGTTIRGFDPYVLLPGEFVVVSRRADQFLFQSYGNTATMPSFPSLTISGKTLVLQDQAGELIDYVSYAESWYQDRIKQNGGYALELINPDAPCKLSSNWIGSFNSLGGTPGSINSTWTANTDATQPMILNAYPDESDRILLTYDKKLDRVSAMDVGSFYLEPAVEIAGVFWSPLTPNVVELTFFEDFVPGQIYRVFSPGLEDCGGNAHSLELSFQLGLPEMPEPLDLVINEVLFQPEVGGSRFVEVFNRSEKIIDAYPLILADFSGSTPDGFRTEVSRLIFPGDIVAFTEDPEYIIGRYAPPDGSIVVNARIPTLSDREGNISVYTFGPDEAIIIDELDYSRDFHYALLQDRRGVSIERIDPEGLTNDINNWHSGAEQVGYATPGYVNSQFRSRNTESDDRVFFEDKFFSPNGDGFKDVLQINYQLDTPGFVATVRIYDSEGRQTRQLVQGELLPASGSFKWDGTNDDGVAARMGIYVVLAELVEPGGTVIRFKQDCVLGGQF